MQIQIGCTVKPTANYGNTHWGTHCLDITMFAYVMQTTIVNLLFCFSFLYKNTSACYSSYWKKKKKRNSKFLSACWFEKDSVDRFVGTYNIWHVPRWPIYRQGANTNQRPVRSRGAHLPPSLLIKRKGDSRPDSRAWEAKHWHWAT